MAILPNSVPQASREQVINMLLSSGLWSNDKVTRLSAVSKRGYYLDSMGKPNMNDRGIYDDALFLISPDTFTSFNGNNDPSRYRQGIATLVAPQVINYKKGWHGYGRASGHRAFRQNSDVVVRRDGGRGNGHPLGGGLFTDDADSRFWTNLHKGGWGTTSSAGCQTVPPNQWKAFYSLVSLQMERYDQDNFNCYLIGDA